MTEQYRKAMLVLDEIEREMPELKRQLDIETDPEKLNILREKLEVFVSLISLIHSDIHNPHLRQLYYGSEN